MTTGQGIPKNGRRLLLTLAAALAVASTMATAAHGRALTPRVELDYDAAMAHDTAVVYVLVDFDAADAPTRRDERRPRLNLALVLDRSGSMEERGKMAYAREAAKMMVDMLGPDDRLAVVEYDDTVTVLWPSAPVESPGLLKRRIDALEPRGSTDLFGGMMAGVEQVRPHRERADIDRVVLLSDGLANSGVTDLDEIVRRVRRCGTQGVSITTLGLGLDYNEDLLQAIAAASGGNYAFIENPSAMRRVFADELRTLTTTVARDVEVFFDPARCVSDVEIFGYDVREDDRGYRIPMENIYAGETRSLLLRLEVETGRPGELDLGEIRISYYDQLDEHPADATLPLALRVTDQRLHVDASCNDRVVVEANLIEADRRLDGIVRMYEGGDLSRAETCLDALASDINTVIQSTPDKRLAAKLEALSLEREDMAAAAGNARASSAFVKQRKANYRLGAKGKQQYLILSDRDKGPEVERLQTALREAGVYSGPVNGLFGDEVAAALKTFQRREGLTVDGLAGPRTQRALGLY